jgi:NADPH2:quinone reductase
VQVNASSFSVPAERSARRPSIAVHLDAEVIALTSDPTMWDDKPAKPQMILDRRKVNFRAVMKERFPDGVDVVLDPVGGDLAAPALRSLQPYGRYLVVGFASGRIPDLPANHILLRNRTVIGVEWATWITANHRFLARTSDVVLNRLARGVFHPPAPNLVPLDRLPAELAGPLPAAVSCARLSYRAEISAMTPCLRTQ